MTKFEEYDKLFDKISELEKRISFISSNLQKQINMINNKINGN